MKSIYEGQLFIHSGVEGHLFRLIPDVCSDQQCYIEYSCTSHLAFSISFHLN